MSVRKIPALVQGGARLFAVLAGICIGIPAQAHEAGHDAARTVAAPEPRLPAGGTRDARTYFTDTEVLDQEGRRLRFYSDVLENRVVLINSIYTHCEDACPLITRKLREVRARLGERFGKEVWFVSISSDPERDSPQALKKFARAQDADEAGWVFLTGGKAEVDRILARLGQLANEPQAHSTLLIAGNVPAKRWSKIRPDAPINAIADRLQLLAKP